MNPKKRREVIMTAMNESMNIMLSAVAIIFIAVFGIMYFNGAMAALDQGVDAEGTEYEDIYDSTRTTAQISISFFYWVPILLSVAMLIFGSMLLFHAGQGRLQ